MLEGDYNGQQRRIEMEQHKVILSERKGEQIVQMVKVISDSTVVGYGSKYYVRAELDCSRHIHNYPKTKEGFYNATGKYTELVKVLRNEA